MPLDALIIGPNGKPVIVGDTPFGQVQLAVEPMRVLGNFKAATNSGIQTQSVVLCPNNQVLFVTDVVLTANKTNGSTVTVRFFDGTNAENIIVADSSENTVALAVHPQGRTIGWKGAAIQLLTDTGGQAATLTVWYVRIKGHWVIPYAKWISKR